MDFESLDSLDRMDDRDLLSRFLAGKDEAAFEALVRRHGPMVARVCARMLDGSDADDAFQATFLVLAQHAAALRKRGSVGPWLYGVAVRVSRKARSGEAARRRREREAGGEVMAQHQDSEARAREQALWREARPLLDEELEALPEKYRAPLILCYLQGRTNEQAAAALGWTKGTLSGRLARARDLLRERLGRRGAVLSLGLLVGLLESEAHAAVAPALAGGTAKAAALVAAGQLPGAGTLTAQAKILYEGVTQMLYWAKVKAAAAVLAATLVVGTGAGVVVWQAQAAESKVPQAPLPQRAGEAPQPVAGGEATPAEAPAESSIDFTLADNGKTVRVKVGVTFAVRLTDDTADAGWEGGLVNPGDEGTLIVSGKDVLKDGAYTFPYRAKAVGTVALRMDYVYPGGPGHLERHKTKLLKEFKLTVEIAEAPVFEKDGLQVFVEPEKQVFAQGEPMAFAVTYKNVSGKAMALPDAGNYERWRLEVTQEGTEGLWSPFYKDSKGPGAPAAPFTLEPGQERRIVARLEYFVRRVPNSKPIAPIGLKNWAHLAPGKYHLTVTVRLHDAGAQAQKAPFWLGQIETKPVPFEIVETPVFEKDGLQVFLKPAKPVFAAKEKLAFTLTYKNSSDKPFYLCDSGFVHPWEMKFTRQGTDGWWSKYSDEDIERQAPESVQLDPSKTLAVNVDMAEYRYLRGGMELSPNAPVPDLLPGKYSVSLAFEIKADPAKTERPYSHWTGKVETKPVAFEIAAP